MWGTTLTERMREYRRRHGLSIKEAAFRACVDESSWGSWERTGLIPWKRYRTLVDAFLALKKQN
jgi:transcriptional regulator with XRE-family HTH domain